jgi:hypothetical protein
LAKLKNAWDEFLMGITNSVVIKAAVDFLTTLLNIVNGLTGAFGAGAGGVLKFGAALGTLLGLKKLFADGGLLGKGIAALGNTGVGKFFGLGNEDAAATKAKLVAVE